jgi:hypothetical protein
MKPCPHYEKRFFSHKTEQVIHGSQKYSASEAMRKPRQSEALRRATSLSTITWKHDVPEKRVLSLSQSPFRFRFPFFLKPDVDCLFVEPRARAAIH